MVGLLEAAVRVQATPQATAAPQAAAAISPRDTNMSFPPHSVFRLFGRLPGKLQFFLALDGSFVVVDLSHARTP